MLSHLLVANHHILGSAPNKHTEVELHLKVDIIPRACFSFAVSCAGPESIQ